MGRLFRSQFRRGQWQRFLGYRSHIGSASLPVSLLAWTLIFGVSLAGYRHFSVQDSSTEDKWSSESILPLRHLLASGSDATGNITYYFSNCSNETRSNTTSSGHGPVWEQCEWEIAIGHIGGFITLYIFITLVIFIALAIVCDDFFVPSLEAISEKLKLSEDVAGATFMAAGSSAPELFSSIAAVTFQSDVGVGTIMGSAVFNMLVIISLTAAFAGQLLHLDWRPLTRDSVFYAVSIGFFIYSVWDTLFQWWEALVMLLLYTLYIIIMVFNDKLMDWLASVQQKCCCSSTVKPASGDPEMALSDSKDVHSAPNGDLAQRRPSLVGGHARRLSIVSQNSMKSGNIGGNAPNVFRHDRRNSVIHSIAQSRSSLRGDEVFRNKRNSVMQSVVNMKTLREDEEDKDGSPIRETNEDSSHETGQDSHRGSHAAVNGDTGSKKDVDEEEEEEEDEPRIECCCKCLRCCPAIRGAPPERPQFEDDVTSGKRCAGMFVYVLKWVIFVFAFPFLCLFSWTIPECSKDHNRKWFLVSFVISVLWIAALSFGMVTVVARMGCLMGIDSYVMSLVVLAAGTSIPDLLSSIIVARDGFGDMAVSNAIGSNVFDIDLGLGLPFLIRMIAELGKPFDIFSQSERKAFCTGKMLLMPHAKFGFILLGLLVMAKFVFIVTRFKLSKVIGVTFFCMYIVFLTYAFVQEFLCNKPGTYNC